MSDLFNANAPRHAQSRSAAAGWAVAGALVCAVVLWYHASVISEHQSELHKIINYSTDAVIVCNSRGQVLYANDAVRAITGFTEEDLVRGGVEQVIPLSLRGAHRSALPHAVEKSERGLEGVSYRRIYPVTRKDGKTVMCLVSVGNVQHSGSAQFFAFIALVSEPLESKKAAPDDTANVP